MVRMTLAALVAAVGLILAACATSKPANDASEVDIGSGKSPETTGGTSPTSAPADRTGTTREPDKLGPGIPESTPKPGGGSAPGSASPGPG